jgi:hypothetical protein
MYGSRRYFSGNIEIPPYSQSIPQTAFLDGGEELIRDRIKSVLNTQEISIDSQLNLATCAISSNNHIWGFVGENGQIFSLVSLLFKKEQLSKDLQEKLEQFNEQHSSIENKISFEDKINSIVSQMVTSSNSTLDYSQKTQSYYNALILKAELDSALDNQNTEKQKFKI